MRRKTSMREAGSVKLTYQVGSAKKYFLKNNLHIFLILKTAK